MDPKAVSAHLSAMKATYLHATGAIALTFGLAACVPQSEPPSPAAPPPVQRPAPPPAAPPPPPPAPEEPQYDTYLDAPQTPGTWTYADETGETLALFGVAEEYRFIVRCDKSTKRIGLGFVGRYPRTDERPMQITTETVSRTLDAQTLRTNHLLLTAELDPRDSLLDAMAITKGRFAVEVEDESTLYLPAWVEISRVIEDCR